MMASLVIWSTQELLGSPDCPSVCHMCMCGAGGGCHLVHPRHNILWVLVIQAEPKLLGKIGTEPSAGIQAGWMAEKPGAGCQEEPSPGGMLACHAGGREAVCLLANFHPPAFPDEVPGSMVAKGLRGLLVWVGPCRLQWGQVSSRQLLVVAKKTDTAPQPTSCKVS